jgi:regulator of sigma E protease
MLLLILASVLMLGISIFIHELGHLLCGIFVGVKARIFSIGYGRGIWKKRIGETIYQVTAIPIGGYVMFKGDQYGRSLKGKQGELLSTPPLKRMIPVIGGPLFNLILGFVLFFLLALLGDKPWSNKIFIDQSIKEFSSAYQAGLRTGDKILSINQTKIESFEDIFTAVGLSGGEEMQIQYERKGEVKSISVTPDIFSSGGRATLGVEPFGDRNIVASFSYSEQIKNWIDTRLDIDNKSEEYFKKNFPQVESKKEKNISSRAIKYLNDGDMILEVEGVKVSTVPELQTLLGKFQNQEVNIKVQRRTLPLLTPLTTEVVTVKVPIKGAEILKLYNLKEKKFSSLGIKNYQIASYDPKIDVKLSNLKFNEINFRTFEDLKNYLSKLDTKQISFSVADKEYEANFYLKPIGLIGFMADIKFEPEKIEKDITITEAFVISYEKVYKSVSTSVKGLGLLFKGLLSVKDNLSGPVGIVHLAGASLEYGWFTYWNFVANISIALMFMNLLPIPVADGGHLVLYLYEAISGKPLHPKVIDTLFKLGFVFLLLLGVMVTYNDVMRFF